MSEIQKGDPRARRLAVLVVVAGAIVGSLLILCFERRQDALRDWILADPAQAGRRLELALVGSFAVLLAPLPFLAAYLWRLGAAVRRAGRFPPPGYRVIRDTPVVVGPGALRRARTLQGLAVGVVAAAVVVMALCWRLAALLAGRLA